MYSQYIALRVAVVHPDRVKILDRFGEQRWRRDAQARVLHVLAEGRSLAAQRALGTERHARQRL
jgi:hypothetical protein